MSAQHDLSGQISQLIDEVERTPPNEMAEEKPAFKARLFQLKWNYSNMEQAPGGGDKHMWHECEGTRYATGWVSLDFGMLFECLGDMKESLGLCGQYEIVGLED